MEGDGRGGERVERKCNVAESKSIETHYVHVHIAAIVDVFME